MLGSPGRDGRVFLSYAHIDNQPLLPGQKGWIENFQYTLRVRLSHLLGDEPEIFWDTTNIRGNDVFAAVIETELIRCSVLIPVVSPSYVNAARSDWCRRELETFCAAAERSGGMRIGEHSRIFKVMKTFVPFDKQPDPLKDLIGYEFYRKDPGTGRVREFALQANLVDPEYIQKVDDLATDIRDFLSELEQRAAAAAAPGAAAQAGPVLYLAETTLDLAAERERVMRMLRQRGYSVLPSKALPIMVGNELRAYVDDCLRRASVSIHLLGASYGTIPEGETQSVVIIQNELAAARSAESTFARFIWISPAVAPTDQRQAAYLAHLRNDAAAQRGAEVVSCSLEELETLIQDAVRRPAPRTPQPATLKYVYLMCDKPDVEAAQELAATLRDSSDQIEVAFPLFEGDDGDARAYHKETLTTCDGVLVYVGSASMSWLEMKKLELHKMDGMGRAHAVRAKAIYLGPPASPAKDRFQSRAAVLLRNPGPPNREALLPFVNQLLQ